MSILSSPQGIDANDKMNKAATTRGLLIGLIIVLVIIVLQSVARTTHSQLISLGIPSQTAAWIALAGPEVIAFLILLVWLYRNSWDIKSFIGPVRLRWWEYSILLVGILIGAILCSKIVGFGLGALFSVLHISVAGGGNFPSFLAPQSPSGYLIVALGVAVPAFVEEFIFRAYLPLVFSRFLPTWMSIALAMILFGSIHYVGVGLINTVGLMFWALIPLLYVLRTQKLIPAILAHYINDFLTFAILIPLTFHPR
jgi:membrane protease YdiL (CAAX protease family)